MTEKLLQFIWQFRHFDLAHLQTEDGDPLQILHPGTLNNNQGPDFLNARIHCRGTTWAGNIELHVLSSQWKLHKHDDDPNYKNIILHVVWQHDADLNLPFPTFVLGGRVPLLFLNRYDQLMKEQGFIACEKNISQVPEIILLSRIDSMLAERLQQRADRILTSLQNNKAHWEEVFWQTLCRSLGTKVNESAFEAIAKTLPISLLAKHKHNLVQVEALLMGQAGLLSAGTKDAYQNMLCKEYHFLKKKYTLAGIGFPIHFLRMRPANFPTIRLAQLAALINESQKLFSKIREATDVQQVQQLFTITANDYWHYHYRFGEETPFKEKQLGRQMIHGILINTVIPILYAYGQYHQNEKIKEKAITWMQQLPAEKNSITNGFKILGLRCVKASESQAYLQLKNEYCNHKRCLQCSIGNAILKMK